MKTRVAGDADRSVKAKIGGIIAAALRAVRPPGEESHERDPGPDQKNGDSDTNSCVGAAQWTQDRDGKGDEHKENDERQVFG